MTQGKKEVTSLIDRIEEGDYVIPHFQRDFEWKPNMVCDLFGSMLEDYYTGTLLLWDLENYNGSNSMWDAIWGVPESTVSDRPKFGILDGQQRLSSVYYALAAPEKKFPNRKSYYYFYLELDEALQDNYDDSFTYEYKQNYRNRSKLVADMYEFMQEGRIPLSLITDQQYLNGPEFQDFVASYRESRIQKGVIPSDWSEMNVYAEITSLINQILNYDFSVEILDTSNLDEVCEIFTRINKKGMQLSTFDLMNAFLFPYDVSLRKDWEELSGYDGLKSVDSKMSTNVLKTIALRRRDYCSSKYIYQLIPGTEVEVRDTTGASRTELPIKTSEEFSQLWKKAVEFSDLARERIISTGDHDFGAIRNNFIPNTPILAVMAALLWEYRENYSSDISQREFDDRIVRWYWSAALSRDYSGSSDSIMSQDFRNMKAWFENSDTLPERIQKVDTEYVENSLNLLNVTQGGRYNAVLGLYGLNNAQDFYTGRLLGTYPADKINDHHIFPKKVQGMDLDSDLQDSILNRTLILDETNRKIRNDRPSDYLKEIEESSEIPLEERMRSHLISEAALDAMWQDDFERFLRKREQAVQVEIKDRLAL